jgi:hypothetical protein
MTTSPSDDLIVELSEEDLFAVAGRDWQMSSASGDLTVNIDEEDLSAVSEKDWHAKKKAADAFVIAVVIVSTFAGVLIITLVITAGILWKSGDPTRVQVFAEAISPIYDSLGKFASTVFGSLLAFILGYYYSKEQKNE